MRGGLGRRGASFILIAVAENERVRRRAQGQRKEGGDDLVDQSCRSGRKLMRWRRQGPLVSIALRWTSVA